MRNLPRISSGLICNLLCLTVIEILQQLNRAVAADDCENMMGALEAIAERANVLSTLVYDAPLYLKLFKKRLSEKESDGSELWLDDIENITEIAKSEIEEIKKSMYRNSNKCIVII